jgi:hypothetical protein
MVTQMLISNDCSGVDGNLTGAFLALSHETDKQHAVLERNRTIPGAVTAFLHPAISIGWTGLSSLGARADAAYLTDLTGLTAYVRALAPPSPPAKLQFAPLPLPVSNELQSPTEWGQRPGPAQVLGLNGGCFGPSPGPRALDQCLEFNEGGKRRHVVQVLQSSTSTFAQHQRLSWNMR